MKANLLALTLALLAASALTSAATAQETAGAAGSPSATTTIPGNHLPPPAAEVRRQDRAQRRAIDTLVASTRGASQGRTEHPLDYDRRTGFGVTSTFGGVVPTPTLDQIAANGLGYTNFNSTALCSPTRAAIITGRNHHSMGFGVVAEQATGFPGYDSFMTRDKATIGKIL